jgi:serine/threonine protein kinase
MTDRDHWITFEAESGSAWRYDPGESLGTPGGFGGVFAGEGADGGQVAVKVVSKHRPEGPLDDRLLRREGEIGRKVSAISIALLLPAFDVAEVTESLLLVMLRAERSLSDLVGNLDEGTVVAILTDIATGLEQLHGAGIIHRDLKPANVLLHEGRWKLADFGIARDTEIGTQSMTFVGWGSQRYTAPELWQMKSPTVKTDLYALGCLAYELLSGSSPFSGDQRAAHLSAAAPDPPAADAVLRNLIGRLLAKDPGERPKDARAVLERLRLTMAPLSPIQKTVADRIGEHTAERSREAAEQARANADNDRLRQQVKQSLADLKEILGDAHQRLQQIEPEARLTGPIKEGWFPATLTLSTGDATLNIDLWDETLPSVPDDTMFVAGGVSISNRRYAKGLLVANAVYEMVGDRFGWQLYQFRPGAFGQSYAYGPVGRAHGFAARDFLDRQQRNFMVHPAMHVWTKSTRMITEDTVLELFDEALALQPPDPLLGW